MDWRGWLKNFTVSFHCCICFFSSSLFFFFNNTLSLSYQCQSFVATRFCFTVWRLALPFVQCAHSVFVASDLHGICCSILLICHWDFQVRQQHVSWNFRSLKSYCRTIEVTLHSLFLYVSYADIVWFLVNLLSADIIVGRTQHWRISLYYPFYKGLTHKNASLYIDLCRLTSAKKESVQSKWLHFFFCEDFFDQ